VDHLSVVSPADADRAGGRARGHPRGCRPSCLPAHVRRLPTGLAVARLGRRAFLRGAGGGRVDDTRGRIAQFPRLRGRRRCDVSLQRSPARVLRGRRCPAAARPSGKSLRRVGGRHPPRGGRADEGGRRGPRPVRTSRRRRRATAVDPGQQRPPRDLAAPPHHAGARIPARRRGIHPAPFVACRHCRGLRELHAADLLAAALAGDPHPPSEAGPRHRGRDAQLYRLGLFLVGRAVRGGCRMAGSAAAPGARPAAARRSPCGNRLALRHHRGRPSLHRHHHLGPLPAPGINALAHGLRHGAAGSRPAGGLAMAGGRPAVRPALAASRPACPGWRRRGARSCAAPAPVGPRAAGRRRAASGSRGWRRPRGRGGSRGS